jgi:putative ABC transport system permease protein
MPLMARARSLIRNLLGRDRIDDDLDAEVRATLQLLIDEKVESGVALDAARRQSMLELGGVESVKARVREIQAGALLETFVLDLRYAARLLRRNPLFTATAALSLAIGIGATTAIFTIANGLLLRSAEGIPRPGTLVEVVRVEADDGPGVSPLSYLDYFELRQRTTTLQDVHAYQLILNPARLEVAGSSERVFPTFVSVNYFRALGVQAAAGRVFDAGDTEQAGASPIAVLSHRFWTRRFGQDAGIVGRSIRINDHPLTIVGVAAEAFRGSTAGAPDVWLPLEMISVAEPEFGAQMLTSGEAGWLMLGARLKPDSSRAQASAELAALGAALDRANPPQADRRGTPVTFRWSVELASPIPYGLRRLAAGFLALLMALVAVVLVIACVNVAGVLLARATVRRREIGIRVASGAARSRLVRQLLTETALLFLLGGAAGLWLARVMTSALVSLLPEFPVPIALSVPLDWRVAGFSLVLTLLASLLAGLAPALHASRSDVVTALKDDVDGASERLWLRHGFVVVQVAFSILLVVTAGMLVRALEEMKNADEGFDVRGVDVAMIDLSIGGYTEGTGAPFLRNLMDRVRALPAVEIATIADRAPGAGGLTLGGLSIPGVTPPPGMRFFYPNWMLVDSGYFATLRIPLLEGRDFTAADSRNGEPVVILSRRAAEQFWPGENAVGRIVEVHGNPSPSVRTPAVIQMRVVGVVGNLSTVGPLELYVPLQQRYWPSLAILARSNSERRLAEDLRMAVKAMDPKLPVLAAQTLESMRNGPVHVQLRLAATVAASVGFVGLLLAAIGVHGVTAYAVTRRTREIGIRLSLGAGRREVVAMVLRHGMMLVLIGSAVGLALSLGVGRVLSGREFGQGLHVPALDVGTFAGAALLFAVVGLIACYVPVRRAARIQAMDALRCE